MGEELMALVRRIESAFSERRMPSRAIDDDYIQMDSDVEDAQWFSGRNWQDLTISDWRGHMSAFTFMSSEAAAYYLPSLLTLSAKNPDEWIPSLDSLMYELDCTPELGIQDERIRSRFLGYKPEEYVAIKEWLLFMSEHAPDLAYPTSGAGDRFGRAFELVDLLQLETDLLKPGMTEGSENSV